MMYEHNGDIMVANLNGMNTNGSVLSTCHEVSKEHVPRDVEMYRLIGQFLCDRGLNGTYAQLSKESGIPLEHTDATDLRHATLEGRWDDAEAAVDRLTPLVGDNETVEEVRFILMEQRFLECLEANEVIPAVTLLRNRITPMQRNIDRVHTLASCLMCRTPIELSAQSGGWTGKDGGSRLQLINRIQALVPAHAMLPPRRLEELIEDSVRSQLSSCLFHNPPSLDSNMDSNTVSLLQRHSCGMQNFPTYCCQNLHQRDGELWFCQFSPDGSYLAVAGKEANVDLLRVDGTRHVTSRFRILETPTYVACLCWSPDSKKVACCCGEEQSSVYVFDVTSGLLLCSQKVNDEDTYSATAFFADSRKLAFGGLKGIFYVMDTEDQGRILTSVEGYRVQSMAAILPPLHRIGHESAHVDELKVSPDLTAPGGPDSLLPASISMLDADGYPVLGATAGTPAVDQLLVADSLHRIRLFRFGHIGPSPNPAAGDIALPPSVEVGGTTQRVSDTGEDEPAPTSSTPADLTVYLSGTAPGAPGTAITSSVDNPAVATALTVARLSRQQHRLLQSTLSGSSTSAAAASTVEQLFWNQPQPSSVQASVQTGTVPSALFNMPILPVGLRLGQFQGGPSAQSQSATFRPSMHHQHHSGPSYTVVSSSSSGVSSMVGPAGNANSLTIVFGAPVDRSVSSTGTTTSTSADVRTLTSSTVAAAHSPSFAGLVRSLSTMVAASSSPIDSSSGRPITDTTLLPSAASVTPLVSVVASTATAGVDAATPSPGGTAQVNGRGGYGLLDHRTLFKETHGVQSIVMSKSGKRALITIHKMGLHLWDVESCSIIQRFIGYKQDTYRILSTFGGTDDHFVASGSENGLIHIWSTNSGNHRIHSMRSPLSGPNHDAITSVHWNPAVPTMMASVNDVGELTIWGPQHCILNMTQPMEESN